MRRVNIKMVLKDWKQGDFINHDAQFVKANKLFISIDNNSSFLVKSTDTFYLEIFNGGSIEYKKILSKYFKTKSQALKFARAYMKTH